MIEVVLFTLNAIVIYLLADWILRFIETRRGEGLKQRQVVFFVIFLALAMISFNVLPMILTSVG